MSPATLAKRERETTIARPLKILVPLIQADIEQGDRAGMEYYADAGDKLIEVKESGQVAPHRWSAWVLTKFDRSERTCYRYMRYARLRCRGTAASISLSEMEGDTKRLRERRHAERAYKEAIRDVDTDIYKQERQTRVDETRLHREIAIELVDIGYKALATRLHPDRGGSKDAMRRLNRVRDELKSVAETRRFE